MNSDATLAAIAACLAQARRVLFITGAGISADSGLPTYRGVGGLYNGEATEDGLSIEQALSGEVFAMRPDITWKYLAQIEHNCRGARPNAAHRAIAELERRLPYVLVLTQNVDGLHRQAGSRNVIEIHGGLHSLFCTACGFSEEVDDWAGRQLPPRCPECGGVVRPDIVLFGEALPAGAIDRLVAAMEEGVDLVVSIGTSAVFPYIVQPVLWAVEAGIPTLEINPGRTLLSDQVDFYLPMGAAAAMSAIMALALIFSRTESALEQLLPAIEVETAANPQYAVIWLHGLGADGGDFAPVVPDLGLAASPGVRFIFPHAPAMPVTCNGGYVMPAWYDIISLDANSRRIDEAGILHSRQAIRRLIARENQRGIPSAHIFLAGFSQGGAVAYVTALTHPEGLAGVIALSTYLPTPQLVSDEAGAANRGIPVFAAHGSHDDVVAPALGRAARDLLVQRGYRLDWQEYPMPHSVCPEEIAAIGQWLRARIAEC